MKIWLPTTAILWLAALALMARANASYLFPPTPFKIGAEYLVTQWCDDLSTMREIVDMDSAKGKATASPLFKKYAKEGKCHWLPSALPTTAILMEEMHFARGVFENPVNPDQKQSIIIEVWRAWVQGVPKQVYIAMFHPILADDLES